ncbi:MFS transporter [Megasphaera paucivorans]|uniref:Sugar phosphate permease n=1 Tax=Megasphaera paucivorans TaxID=349095 RepID=A0A1H0C2L6_9FIRM|nr:MFS transporter [Megasphaera paucivorans]SDN52105.1 Sugar phosphate permease [Megasphaera paucivorans]
MENSINIKSLYRKRQIHIILPVFFVSVIAFLDRVNVAYAGMTMTKDLPWLSPEIFGAGAGMFFLGYFFFEIPGALFAAKFDACKWIARIMFTWGLVCGLLAFVQSPTQFYIVRFLLGACEASLYPVIYAVLYPRWFMANERAAAISLMLTSLPVSNIIGAPLAGVLLEMHLFGLQGWQSLFVLEAIPAIIFTFVFVFWVKDRPSKSQWLTDEEKVYMENVYKKEQDEIANAKKYTIWQALTDKTVWRLVIIYFFWATGFLGFSFWMPQVLKNLSGWSTSVVGFALVIPMIIALCGQLVWGMSSSRTGEKRWHVATAMFLGAIGLGGAPFISSPLLSLVFVTFVAVGINAAMGVWWSVPTTFLSGAAAAGATALINSLANLGGYFGPYMLGMVKTYTGTTDLGYFILSGGLCISALLMLTLKKTMPTDKNNI